MRTERERAATGFEFPCEYPIKAMGRTEPGFRELVVDIVTAHAGKVREDQVRVRASSGGKFQSVTVTVLIESRAQLEGVYRELGAAEPVLWTL